MSALLDPAAPFVALDFETANTRKESACEIGLVFVDATTRRMRRFSSRIKPPTRDFHPACQRVHGIRWADVADKPTFVELWPEIKKFLVGATFLVAHNAAFDRAVFEACCNYYNIATPLLPFECTLKLAKTLWPVGGAKLNECAARIGFALKHHAAASDAEACARIVIWARDQQAPKAVVDEKPSREELVARKAFARADDDALYAGAPPVVLELRGNPEPPFEPPVPWEKELAWVKREIEYLGGGPDDFDDVPTKAADPTARWAAGTRKKQDEPRPANAALDEIASWDPPQKPATAAPAPAVAHRDVKPAKREIFAPCADCGAREYSTDGHGHVVCEGCGVVVKAIERMRGARAVERAPPPRARASSVPPLTAAVGGQRPLF